MAKSLLCVANIAKSAALPRFIGLEMSRVIPKTAKNTIALATVTPNKNFQLTKARSN